MCDLAVRLRDYETLNVALGFGPIACVRNSVEAALSKAGDNLAREYTKRGRIQTVGYGFRSKDESRNVWQWDLKAPEAELWRRTELGTNTAVTKQRTLHALFFGSFSVLSTSRNSSGFATATGPSTAPTRKYISFSGSQYVRNAGCSLVSSQLRDRKPV